MNKLLRYASALAVLLSSVVATDTFACTNLIVGKKASKDGSVIISYSADSYGAFGALNFQPAAKHQPGDMRALYDYETNNYLGSIPEVPETYQVVGLMNEFQLAIHETTFGGREELVDTAGIFDYGSLMFVTLQRAKTAREAIDVMTKLVEEYGYRSEGESFTIADPNEVWIMEMIGKGPGCKGANWVAVRIPDDCISGHANQSRIRQFPLKDQANCLYSKDIIQFAREKGFFSGKDAEFSFSEAYSPADFGAMRFCEARVWSYFNRWGDLDMNQYLDYAKGENPNNPMPLYVRPKALLDVQDVKDMMRDHYEGTPFDNLNDVGMGHYEMPYRATPLTFEVDGQKYFHERPISTQQTSDVYVSQMRSWLPDYVGGILWYGNDDANMIPLTPLYCCLQQVPDCYSPKLADCFHFSFRNAYWVQNWVSNMVYSRYCDLFPELKDVRDRLEKDYRTLGSEMESKALQMPKEEAVRMLSDYSVRQAQGMLDEWNQLGQMLIVKYNDMAIKDVDENGQYKRTPGGVQTAVKRPGYPEAFRRRIIQETGDRYRVK